MFKTRQLSLIWVLRFHRTKGIQWTHWGVYWLHRFDLFIPKSTGPVHPSLHYLYVDDLRFRDHHRILVQNHEISFLTHLNWAHDVFHVTLPCRIYSDCFDGLVGRQALRFTQNDAVIFHFSSHRVIDASNGVHWLTVIIWVHGGSQF